MCNEDDTSDYLLHHCVQVLVIGFFFVQCKVDAALFNQGISRKLWWFFYFVGWGGVGGWVYLDSCSIMCMLDHMEGGRYENLQ